MSAALGAMRRCSGMSSTAPVAQRTPFRTTPVLRVALKREDATLSVKALAVAAKSKAQHSNPASPANSSATIESLSAELAAAKAENAALRQQVLSLGATPVQAPQNSLPTTSATGGATQPRAAAASATPESIEKGIRWPKPGSRFWNEPPREERAELEDNTPCGTAVVPRDPQPMHVVHMTAELAPFAKVGGLGDVVQGLAKASAERGHHVQVMMPHYTCLPPDCLHGLEQIAEFDCPKGRNWDGEMQQGLLRTAVHKARIDDIEVLLVAPADRDASNLFKGDRIYGGSYNELEAYLYFCRAGLEALRHMGQQPDILHLHEWQCSAAAMLYWDVFHHNGLANPRLVLTIHNMDNSGECRQDEFAATGVPGELFADIDKALDERTIGHNPERLNLMKGGIVYSNHITTVSPTYAREVREGGAAGFLRALFNQPQVSAKFSGVINGIDTHCWCPSTDPLIPAPFNNAVPAGKALCKRFLQEGLGLAVDPEKPLVACITRLVPQKGIHMIRRAVFETAAVGGQFVLLGSGHADGDFRALAEGEFRDSKDVRLMVMYSEALAHMIYAAADYVIVPSMFEPCGLTQIIAMRYGALPIVRRTGGLADTVTDLSEGASGNGIVFDGADEDACAAAVSRAAALFRDDRATWSAVSARNMDIDSSWAQSAAEYHDIYRSVRTF